MAMRRTETDSVWVAEKQTFQRMAKLCSLEGVQ